MSMKELKEVLQLNSTHFLNVYFASSVQEELAGAGTWPWDKDALSHLGGVVLNPAYYGMPGHINTMIHEIGHVLGLYHVFKGVDEKDSCDDPCRETTPSMETGDLCADTAPTLKSKVCRDPDPINDTCGHTSFSGTPFNNYMSYTDDNCTDNFTPNQVARMHCYLDLVYQQWTQSRKPTPVPLPPMVVGQSQDTLTIHWLPPISGMLYERESGNLCGNCAEDGTFSQYVHEASSPLICDSSGYWTPKEAVGPPDVTQPCETSLQAWSPEFNLFNVSMTTPCLKPFGCILELYFLYPVYSDSLLIWTTNFSINSKALSDIEILTEQGDSVHLGPMDTFCDIPLTVKLNLTKKVTGLKIYTFDEKMEIDAAQLISTPHSLLCSNCKPVKYRILRDPPFQDGSPAMVMQPGRTFIDKEVTIGQRYQYQVQAIAGAAISEASPPLFHIHGSSYCGDGQVSRSLVEECDDGNLLEGDGCSRNCKKERGYHCIGEPSLCYVHEGDGICEPFEERNSIVDCGLFTPKDYVDQWASDAYASHQDEKTCPVFMVIGEPLVKVCRPHHQETLESESQLAWFPCMKNDVLQDTDMEKTHLNDRIWLKVCFSQPRMATSLFVFLASVGTSSGDHLKPSMTIHLGDINGHNHFLATSELSCQQNPLVINMTGKIASHQITYALFNFSSLSVSISAVALRTRLPFDSSSPTSKGSLSPERASVWRQGSDGSGRCLMKGRGYLTGAAAQGQPVPSQLRHERHQQADRMAALDKGPLGRNGSERKKRRTEGGRMATMSLQSASSSSSSETQKFTQALSKLGTAAELQQRFSLLSDRPARWTGGVGVRPTIYKQDRAGMSDSGVAAAPLFQASKGGRGALEVRKPPALLEGPPGFWGKEVNRGLTEEQGGGAIA
ncbi:pappalysin-2 [Crotalus adamanteus]|uniref:Pappalysin-2 n=1 Tax=Crotalus adamanteus TaxID=8729 RepID=A0AAW1BQ39_CROAD